MKKSLFTLLFACCLCGTVSAQKGMSGVGGNVGGYISLDDDFSSMGGLHVKYYYNLSDHFRLQPSLMLNSGNKHTMPGASFDVHYLFGSPKAVRPYVTVGLSALGFEEEHHYYSSGTGYDSEWAFGPNLGLGLDWRVSHSLSIQLEAKSFKNIADHDGAFIGIALGLSYNF